VTGTGGSTGDWVGVVGTGTGRASGVTGVGGPNAGDGVGGFGTGGGNGVSGSGGNGTGAGVWGTGGGGPGVRGTSKAASAPGMLAENTAGGTALQVAGPAAFSRSGALTVAAGKSSATKTGVVLTTASLILATLQQHTTGVYVTAAVPNVTGSSFTVYLSKAVSAATTVAWFVVN
jgi:hypothetical protein